MGCFIPENLIKYAEEHHNHNVQGMGLHWLRFYA